MKYIYKKSIIILAGLLSLITFNACNNDDEPVSEWEANYVYLQKEDYLLPDKTIDLVHNPLGIEGAIAETFFVKLKYPTDNDVVVTLGALGENIPSDLISLSPQQVTIKAGEQTSEAVTVSVPDWSFAANEKGEMSYELKVSISDIQTKEKDLRISNIQKTKLIAVSKGAYSLIATTMPNNWATVNRSGWKATASHNYSNSYPVTNAIDDDMNSTWFAYGMDYNGGECWLNVELDSPINLVGFSITKENAFGGYSVKQSTIQIKKEGEDAWTTFENVYKYGSFSGSTPQYVILSSTIEHVKEFRINILFPSDFTGLSDLNLYINK